jgi:hypothetical protein
MKNKIIISFALAFLMMEFISCQSQSGKSPNSTPTGGYAIKFDSEFKNQSLLLGCMVYAENAAKKLSYDTNKDFLRIASDFFRSTNPYKKFDDVINIDSVIDSYIAKNRNIDFNSNEAKRGIRNFIDNYNIVSDVIFGKIDSDDKSDEMKLLEEKVKKVPAIFKIYNSYMEGRPDLSSLSSAEGSALYIELGFYLSNQDIYTRNDILKKLL